jgi:hypothetical protein
MSKSNCAADPKDPKVALMLYFDEAHCLHEVETCRVKKGIEFGYISETRTSYYAVCSALDELRSLDIFTIFMSTASSLVKFAPTRRAWRSTRSTNEHWDFKAPFTELPFDIHRPDEPLVVEGEHSLVDVCALEFMARFGRPL